MLSKDEIKRYNRHLVLSDIGIRGQEKLKLAKVLVVGAGGLGSPVLQYLAAAGVGHIGIVDFDKIELSNLQRQVIFTTEDVGQPKAAVAQVHLQKLNSEITVTAHQLQLTAENALQTIAAYDLIIDCSDNFPTRYLVNDACVLQEKTLIYGAIYKFEGQVAVFNAPLPERRSAHYRDLYPTPPTREMAPNCNDAGVMGVLPGIIGSLQANEAIKIICGIGQPLIEKLLLFDLLSVGSTLVKFSPSNKPITTLINYEKFCNIDNTNKNDTMKEVTVQELKTIMDSGQPYQLIDVREQHEVDIADMGGELIPMGEVMQHVDKFSKDKQVIVHCRSGARSGNVITALEQQFGFDNLYNLKGGILAWADEIDSSLTKY
jgi:adenylyltransferase/sulfurtransferase